MIAAVVLMLLASPVQAQAKPEAPKKEKMICKRDHLSTGSRLGRSRTCKTAEQWAIYNRDIDPNNRLVDSLGMRGTGVGPRSIDLPR